jgi:hypothetical protein
VLLVFLLCASLSLGKPYNNEDKEFFIDESELKGKHAFRSLTMLERLI